MVKNNSTIMEKNQMHNTYLNENINNLNELHKKYATLASLLHTDAGGGDTQMAILNKEYNAIKARIANDAAVNEIYALPASIAKDRATACISMLKNALKEGKIKIEITGTWIWISGETKPLKDILKSCGACWSNSKKCWYLMPPNVKKAPIRGHRMAEIRAKYGSRILAVDEVTA